MRALEFITGHVIYNPAYAYKFQLKPTKDGQNGDGTTTTTTTEDAVTTADGATTAGKIDD